MPGACRFTIKGRVQGVWFRDSTRRKAEALSVTGSAVNLPSGDVEVFAYGAQSAIDELGVWLQTGPPMARVSEVVAETVEWQAVDGFSIA